MLLDQQTTNAPYSSDLSPCILDKRGRQRNQGTSASNSNDVSHESSGDQRQAGAERLSVLQPLHLPVLPQWTVVFLVALAIYFHVYNCSVHGVQHMFFGDIFAKKLLL